MTSCRREESSSSLGCRLCLANELIRLLLDLFNRRNVVVRLELRRGCSTCSPCRHSFLFPTKANVFRIVISRLRPVFRKNAVLPHGSFLGPPCSRRIRFDASGTVLEARQLPDRIRTSASQFDRLLEQIDVGRLFKPFNRSSSPASDAGAPAAPVPPVRRLGMKFCQVARAGIELRQRRFAARAWHSRQAFAAFFSTSSAVP